MPHHGNGGPKDCAEQPNEDYSEHERIGEFFHHHVACGEKDNRRNQADEERILRSYEGDEAVSPARRGLSCLRSGHGSEHIEGDRATQSLGASERGTREPRCQPGGESLRSPVFVKQLFRGRVRSPKRSPKRRAYLSVPAV